MSLLRRRAMMENQEQEENVIYIYRGYIGNGAGASTYDQLPEYSSQYPNAIATSSIPIEKGDSSIFKYTGYCQERVRGYGTDGIQTSYYTSRFDNIYNFDGYIRFLATDDSRIEMIEYIKIVKQNGTEIDYKIIDRR